MTTKSNMREGRNGGLLNNGGNFGGGRPKNSKSKKRILRQLIKDIAAITNTLSEREKLIAYQLYEIADADLLTSISSSVQHLYFFKSDIGIKIGKTKNVKERYRCLSYKYNNLEIIKVVKHAGKFENKLHKRFEKYNISNNPTIGIEWFKPNDELMRFIDDVNEINDLHRYFNPMGVGQIKLF